MASLLSPNLSALVYALISIAIAVGCMRFLGFSVPLQNRVAGSWVALTCVAFFSLSMWMFYALVALVCWIGAPKAPEERVIYFIGILPALPKFEFLIPGFAGIETLFSIDYARFVTMAVLLPLAAGALRSTSLAPRSRTARNIDFFVLAYVMWAVLLAFDRNGLTQGVRALFQQLMFVALPYLVVSRYLVDSGRAKEALSTLLYSALIVATIGIVEQLTDWWFYRYIPERIGMGVMDWRVLGHYERAGLVRVRSTIGGGLGFVMVIGIAILITMRYEVRSRVFYFGALAALALCLYFTGARGSWLAGVLIAGLLSVRWFIKSPKHFLAACGLAVLLLPAGQAALESAEDEEGTFDYRKQLIDAAIPMILDSPISGYNGIVGVEETGRLEHLRQGEGIIDLVNTYIQVAMLEGLVGLALFLASLLLALFAMLRVTSREIANDKGEAARLSLLLSAIIITAAFLIATTSMTGYFQDYYMIILALSAALVAPADPARTPLQVRRAAAAAAAAAKASRAQGANVRANRLRRS
jgi:O-antigen ligase